MAAVSSKMLTYEDVMKDVLSGNLKPVYLLMGVENYYIDRITEAIIEKALPEEDRDFNMHVFYGGDTDINSVINAAQSFPMGAERSLVIIKEAQDLKGLEDIAYYLQNPQTSTILIIVYKNGTVDGRKKFVSQIVIRPRQGKPDFHSGTSF